MSDFPAAAHHACAPYERVALEHIAWWRHKHPKETPMACAQEIGKRAGDWDACHDVYASAWLCLGSMACG